MILGLVRDQSDILQNNAQFQTLMIKGLPLVYKDTLSNQNIRFIANVIRIRGYYIINYKMYPAIE
jgi:hypothetical protein